MNDTREYIIDQAYNLFLNHSYEAVSINEISKAIGFTKGALYHHFKNKEDLFKAVIDKHLNFQIEILQDTDLTLTEYVDKIVHHSHTILNSITEDGKQTITLNYLALYIDAFRHYPEFSKEKGDFIKKEILKIEKIIRNSMDKGEVRKDVHPDIMAVNFFALSLSMVADLLQNNSTGQALELLRLQLMELYNLIKT